MRITLKPFGTAIILGIAIFLILSRVYDGAIRIVSRRPVAAAGILAIAALTVLAGLYAGVSAAPVDYSPCDPPPIHPSLGSYREEVGPNGVMTIYQLDSNGYCHVRMYGSAIPSDDDGSTVAGSSAGVDYTDDDSDGDNAGSSNVNVGNVNSGNSNGGNGNGGGNNGNGGGSNNGGGTGSSNILYYWISCHPNNDPSVLEGC